MLDGASIPLKYMNTNNDGDSFVFLWRQLTFVTRDTLATAIEAESTMPVLTCPDRHVFRSGDRVEITSSVFSTNVLCGLRGTVLYVPDALRGHSRRNIGFVGVRFDERIEHGHNGLGQGMTCRAGHGWYVSPKQLKYLGWRVNPATVERAYRKRRRCRRRSRR